MGDSISIEQLAQMTPEQRSQIYQANNLPRQQIDQIESKLNSNPSQSSEKPDESCIFCSIAKGTTPSKKVAENNDFIAVLDIQPKTPGHTVLVSKRHIDRYENLSDAEITSLNQIKKTVLDKMTNSVNATGSTIITVNGISSGQKVMHFSEHLIPTYGEYPELPGLDIITPQRSSALVHNIIQNKIETAMLSDMAPKKPNKNQDNFNF